MVQADNVVECSLWKGQPVTECLVVLLSAARYSMTVWLIVDGDQLVERSASDRVFGSTAECSTVS